MRGFPLLAALLFVSSTAWAIKPPSTVDEAKIQALIDKANEINKTSSANPNVRDISVVEGDLSIESLKPAYLQNRGAIAHLQSELKGLKKQRDVFYQQAIRQTLLAYDLVPKDSQGVPVMPTKTAVHPSFKGRNIHWIVVYKDDEDRALLDNGTGVQIVPAGMRREGGLTGADGVTTMYGHFQSPADLALMLYHEKVHYEQFTTPGVGDTLIYDEREEKAYQAEYQHLKEFGLSPTDKKAFEEYLAGDGINPGKIREHHEKARSERLKGKLSLGIWGASEPVSISPHSKSEYDALVAGSKDFDAQLIEAANTLKKQAQKDLEDAERQRLLDQKARREKPLPLIPDDPGPSAPVADKAPPPLPQNDPSMTAFVSLNVARSVARDACANPPRLFERSLAMMSWPQMRMAAKDAQSSEAGLSDCELRVYRRMVEFGRTWQRGQRFSADDVRAAVMPPSTYRGTPSSSAPRTRNCWTDGEGNRVCEEQ